MGTAILNKELKTITNRFGTFEASTDKTITLPHGIIGLPDYKRFCLINVPNVQIKHEYLKAFKLLQCLDAQEIAFLMLPLAIPTPWILEDDIMGMLHHLAIPAKQALILLVTSIQRQNTGKLAFAVNVKAPIVLDSIKATGVQYVLTSPEYLTNLVL